MFVVFQRARKEHAHEITHLVVESVRRGRRDWLVVLVDQDDGKLLRERMDRLGEESERFGKLVLRSLAVYHLAQRPFLCPVSPPVLNAIRKSGDLVADHGGKASERLFYSSLLDVLERQEDHRVPALLLAVLSPRRPDLLVTEQRRLTLVERAEHLQHGCLAEAPRAREQHHARLRVDEVLQNERLVNTIGIA